MAKLCKLSEEMVVEILSRLPPKSLMRFKCVRRSWCDLIKNPNFVEKHLSNPKHNKLASSTSIIVKRTVPKGTNIMDKEETFIRNKINLRPDMMDVFSLLNVFDDGINDGDVHHAATVEVENFWLRKLPFNVKMLGHCDGIICLQYPNDVIVLCNPAIKEFKLLPESCLLHPPWPRRHLGIDKGEEIITFSNAVGFGYDSKTKQYKVVRIVNFFPRPSSEEEVCTPRRKAEVYALGTNSWRVIECDIKAHVFWMASFDMYFKGIFYWYAASIPQDNEVILSFDMSEEVFHNIPLPDNFRNINGWLKSLAVWNDSIALLLYNRGGDHTQFSSFEIWVMDDSKEVKGSWIKHLSIGTLQDILIPLTIWKSDELLIVSANGHVVSYNLSTKTRKYVSIRGVDNPRFIQAAVHVNSVISVKGDNTLEVLSRETTRLIEGSDVSAYIESGGLPW